MDHTDEAQVRDLFDRVRREQEGRLDILVNDVWGGDELSEWGTPFWEQSLEKGFRLLDRAVRSHIITSRHGAPPIVARREGLIVEVTDGMTLGYRGTLFYSLAKIAAIHLADAMAADLDRHLGEHRVTALAVTPGWLRSEAMLDGFGVTEATWRDQVAKDPSFEHSETPYFVGRAVAELAADPEVRIRGRRGRALSSWDLAELYGFDDVDGRRPNWGRFWAEHHAEER